MTTIIEPKKYHYTIEHATKRRELAERLAEHLYQEMEEAAPGPTRDKAKRRAWWFERCSDMYQKIGEAMERDPNLDDYMLGEGWGGFVFYKPYPDEDLGNERYQELHDFYGKLIKRNPRKLQEIPEKKLVKQYVALLRKVADNLAVNPYFSDDEKKYFFEYFFDLMSLRKYGYKMQTTF